MKNIKVISLIIIGILLISSVAYADSTFPDLKKNDWYYDDIQYLVNLGVISGMPDGTFSPKRNVTKSEFTAMLMKALGYKDMKLNKGEHWAIPYIEEAEFLGILDEDEFTTDIDTPINRGEVAKMVVKAMEEIYPDEKYPKDLELYKFSIKNYEFTPKEMRPYVLKVFSKGMMTKQPDGRFNPLEKINRAESCAVLSRMLRPEIRKVPNHEKIIEGLPEWLLKSDKELFCREDVADRISTYAFNIKDGELTFNDFYHPENPDFKDYSAKDTIVPEINKKTYELVKALVLDDFYVRAQYDCEYKIIKIDLGKTDGYCANNGYIYRFTLNEEPFNAKKCWIDYDNLSEKVEIDLDLRKLTWMNPEKMIDTRFSSRLKNSFIVLFGKDTGGKIYEYVIDKYKTYYRDTTYRTETVIIDNIQVDYLEKYGSHFYFTRLK